MDELSKAIAHLAKRDPDRPAVIDEQTFLTYGILHERANCWAFALSRSGFSQGQEVMFLIPNRADFIELLIGAIRVGVVPLILNTEIRSQDVASLAARTRTEALITSRELARKMNLELETNVQVFCIEDFDLLVSQQGDVTPPRLETNIVFFTSGTSGKPKGTVVPKSVFNLTTPTSAPGKKPLPYLLCRPLFFRAHMTAVCNILQEGNTVVLARQAEPGIWMSLIERCEVHFVSLGPSDIKRWLDVLELKGHRFPLSVKHIMSTGAPLSRSMKLRISKLLPHVRVTDLYGTSEVGAIATIDNDEWESKPGSCGKPLFFSTVKIMDSNNEEAVAYEVGEICVKSRYCMREYYKDQETTAQVFKGDYIRTGDLGYLDEQGYLYVIGRMNRVLNCSGFQVIPEEVENVLREWPYVKDAVVIGKEHPEKTQQPIAFVQLREQAWMSREAKKEMEHKLLAYCNRRLAGYKVPAAVLFIEDISLNAAGKTDYRELMQKVAQQHE